LGHGLAWALNPSSAHGLVMSLGFMPLFIAGFLFTAGPRWLKLTATAVTARDLRAPVAAMASGWLAVMIGFHAHALLAAAGMAAVAAGWTALSLRFRALLRLSRAADRRHPTLIGFACLCGALAMWAAAASLAADHTAGLRAATQ